MCISSRVYEELHVPDRMQLYINASELNMIHARDVFAYDMKSARV